MHISHAEVRNFRALQHISIPLNQLSVLIGENDVGKTSFLHALNVFYNEKKISDENDFFKKEVKNDILISLTFQNVPAMDAFKALKKKDGGVTIKKVFTYGKAPSVRAVLEDGSEAQVPKDLLDNWFSSDNFHFIPVRRDLSVQFSMGKTALLGKTLRAKMKLAVKDEDAQKSIQEVQVLLRKAIEQPEKELQKYLQEQMHNDALGLAFKDIVVDPVEGVSFDVRLSDDRVDDVLIENRGAGTQNNLVIALFRLIASLHVGDYFIFAMEEPENSLHPKAQRQLLSVIQDISKESQVICTTHSSVFIERSNFENNVLLTRTLKGNTIAKTFDDEMLDRLRSDLGIRPSDALLKGGGNCAILVEGNTEEDGFPVFMEMLGMSEFQLGVSIVNLRGPSKDKVQSAVRLLSAYGIPCVVVLDQNNSAMRDDILREKGPEYKTLEEVYLLSKGNIEDYYPIEIIVEVINEELGPEPPISVSEIDSTKHGDEFLNHLKKLMHDHKAGRSLGYFKRKLGVHGTRKMKERNLPVDLEIKSMFERVKSIVEKQ